MKPVIDVAVLGIGNMGSTHVKAAKESPYVKNIYGYEPNPDRAAERGRELGINATSDLGMILNNPNIKLVCIAAPNAVHASLTEQALRAGKAVLCEKPMGETIEEAARMIKAEQETGNFLQIGFELHYSKLYMLTKEWIDKGYIGTPVNCHCRYYSSEFHRKNTWRSLSTGSLIGEKLSHYLDLQRWWLGGHVEEVFSMTAPNVVNYFNHPDNHQISFRFDNGVISNLNFVMYIAETDSCDPLQNDSDKYMDDGHFMQYHIFGTKGAIELDAMRRRLRRWAFSDGEQQLLSKIVETITFTKEEGFEWFHNVHGQNLRVIELVANGMSPENPAKDSFITMLAGFAAELSEREKRIVKMSEFANIIA